MKFIVHHTFSLGLLVSLSACALAAKVAQTSVSPEPSKPSVISAPQEASSTSLVRKIETMEEYEKYSKAEKPTIIVFNSERCSACKRMEKGLDQAVLDYPEVDICSINTSNEVFKGIEDKAGIKAYPTTHFIKNGSKKRSERGSMGDSEIDSTVYELVHGKRKSVSVESGAPVEGPATKKQKI